VPGIQGLDLRPKVLEVILLEKNVAHAERKGCFGNGLVLSFHARHVVVSMSRQRCCEVLKAGLSMVEMKK
jgi:hypothetical protein